MEPQQLVWKESTLWVSKIIKIIINQSAMIVVVYSEHSIGGNINSIILTLSVIICGLVTLVSLVLVLYITQRNSITTSVTEQYYFGEHNNYHCSVAFKVNP